jgi:hypothetical protein
MHESAVYYAILNELYRNFPADKATQEGREKLEKLAVGIMTSIREAGVRFVNAKENGDDEDAYLS